MSYALRIHQTGGPDVFRWEKISLDTPAGKNVLIRHTAIGVNYIDTYHRAGLYPLPLFPATLGVEGVGVVENIGEEVEEVAIGDRVGYCSGPLGGYAQSRLIPAEHLIPLPDWLSDQNAASCLLQGLTARYLVRQTYPIQQGDTILIHAAAGGVGLLLCQWARHLGARVLGTVSSQEKADRAKAHGCTHPILYTQESFREKVKDITQGQGVSVVYDSVGKETFLDSLDCVKPLGTLVSFGQSSGKIPPFDISLLAAKGSLFLTRPTLFSYVSQRPVLLESAAELFSLIQNNVLRVGPTQTFPLQEARQAHISLEQRATTGSTILIP